ncbi:MAG: DUF1638 domain-containing protein [Marinosulfonomonas sp.]|nr:DUF1638 domain-containing protein [Marinosulfonomonas sp.]
MQLPDATTLTTCGLSVSDPGGRILLIACGAIAREVLAVTQANGWTHIDLTCLPAILHNHPDRITPAIKQAVDKNHDQYAQIFVLYADCGTGGELFDLCKKLGVEMLKGPHCYSFFEGNAGFAERSKDEFTAFYLTDFLVRQFDAFVWKPLGLDRHPHLRDAYFGNYEKLVYQAQSKDRELDHKAQDCAARLGLNYERRFTGYGDLESTLTGWID